MRFLLILMVTTASVLVLREPLRRWPAAFYALAVLAVLAFFAGASGVFPGTWWKPLTLLVQRCTVALSLFTVVMFIGVLPKGSRFDSWLRPVRAELSIVACILCMGHMCMYLVPFASRALAGALAGSTLASFAVALVLFVLLILLGVTSFGFVKRRMSGSAWKNIQRLAYPFFGLIWVHLMLMLAPAAIRGGEQAMFAVAVYTALFTAYAVLRLFRRWRERA